MTSAAKRSVSTRKVIKFLKPYWSPALGNFHKNIRTSRFAWIADGIPRNGESYDRYKNFKRDFRRNLRTTCSHYEQAELKKLNDLSETDQTAFWKVLNSKKSKTRNKGCTLLVFNGAKENTSDGVLSSWKGYLYAVSEDKRFDDNFRDTVERAVDSYIRECDSSDDCRIFEQPITVHELSKINGKSGSSDNITYENLKYVGETLTAHLTQLFNLIINTEKIPAKFKTGLTVTLHTGKGKSQTEPSNFRAISHLPVVYKLFAKILLSRLETKYPKINIHNLQHGFQAGKCCKLTSSLLQESRDYCYERGSDLHACFLDAKAAFVKVWISGLIYKLYHLRVRGKPLRIINHSLRGASSQVLQLSEPFSIKQGTRHGSICAPFYYIVYINDLLKELSCSPHGLHIGDLSLSAPTQADDIVILSLSRKYLQVLLNICCNYVNTWRYVYNANKCAVMTMSRKTRRPTNPSPLLCGITYLHPSRNSPIRCWQVSVQPR